VIATREFLAGAGAPILVLDELARPIMNVAQDDLRLACEKVAVALVNRIGTAKVAALAAQVPDSVLAQLLLAEQASVVNGLAACGQGDLADAGTQFKAAALSSDLVHRRLKELGS
jgi:hypothetical protein